MNVRPSILIIQNNKILLLKYSYSGKEVFALPGGSPEGDETMESALVRELHEELMLGISVDRLVFAGEVMLPDKKKSTLHCVFTGEIISGIPVVNAAETSALGFQWMDVKLLDSLNLYPNIGGHIQTLIKNGPSNENVYLGKIPQQWF